MMRWLKFDKKEIRNEIVKYASAFLGVMIVASLLVLLQGGSPGETLKALVAGAVGSKYAIGNTLRWIIPCMFTGLAATVAFKSGIMNLGLDGQLYFGALISAILGYAVSLPPFAHVSLCVLGGAVGGLLYALLPMFLRLIFKIDELITTLMLNYVAILMTQYLLIIITAQGSNVWVTLLATPKVSQTARLPVLIKGTQFNAGIFIVLALVIALYVVYKYTIKGYELKQIGKSLNFARVGGINIRKTYALAFMVSGLIAGICGSVEVLGTHYTFTTNFATNLGWDGIMIALVAKSNPIGVLIIAILWGILKSGSLHIERVTEISRTTVVLVQALFVLFVTVDIKKVKAKFQSASRSFIGCMIKKI